MSMGKVTSSGGERKRGRKEGIDEGLTNCRSQQQENCLMQQVFQLSTPRCNLCGVMMTITAMRRMIMIMTHTHTQTHIDR